SAAPDACLSVARVCSSLAASRPARASRSPSWSSATAIPWPIPLPAPVTRAVFGFVDKVCLRTRKGPTATRQDEAGRRGPVFGATSRGAKPPRFASILSVPPGAHKPVGVADGRSVRQVRVFDELSGGLRISEAGAWGVCTPDDSRAAPLRPATERLLVG